MHLSQNIKRFRRARGLSQEYVAESLCMNQSTYSRIENCETTCLDWLVRIAKILETTPDVLRTYHLSHTPEPPAETTENKGQPETMLLQKDEVIRYQAEEISFLRQQVSYLQAVWHQYCGGGAESVSRSASIYY